MSGTTDKKSELFHRTSQSGGELTAAADVHVRPGGLMPTARSIVFSSQKKAELLDSQQQECYKFFVNDRFAEKQPQQLPIR
jgi:hypothetical protein